MNLKQLLERVSKAIAECLARKDTVRLRFDVNIVKGNIFDCDFGLKTKLKK